MGMMVGRLRNLNYRQHSFEKKLYDLEMTMSGRSNSILPDIVDSEGKCSEERIMRFIEDNISRLDEYGRANSLWREEGYRTVLSPHMPQILRTCLENFLYCAVKVILTNEDFGRNTLVTRPVSTFEQIYQMAAGLEWGEMRFDDIFSEYYSGDIVKFNLLAYCDPIYELLTGKKIKEIITDEMLDRANKLYEKDVERLNAPEFNIDDLPDDERAILEEEAAWIDSASGDELVDVLGQSVISLGDFPEYREVKERFEHPEIFCEKYERFRTIYFSDELPADLDFALVVKRMLNIYLCSNNKSLYKFEDAYSDSYIYMKRAHRMVRLVAGQRIEWGR